jgi:5-methylcytosine-specific restriction endonuclease McrA
MGNEEQESKNNIITSGTLPYPKDPHHPIFNGRNLVCVIISMLGFAILSGKYGNGAFIFIPGIFILSIFVVSRLLKESDDQINREYSTKVYEYNNSIKKKFTPSPDYLKFKKVAEGMNQSIVKNEILKKKYYTKLSSVEFNILVNKKVLIEFKRFKKRASERERTSKINAFEMKNRSGAQNIKEKLLKPIRGKSNWSCPYCTNLSDVNLAEADHIHPVNKGGLTTLQNMVLICKKCNSKKTNLMLRVFCKKYSYDYNEVCDRLEKLGKDV